MHFTQIFTAAMALPALGMAAALPLSSRQAITRDCLGFNFLSVGSLSVSNNNVEKGDAIIQIKPEGAGENSWQTKLFVPKGAKNLFFDVPANTGVKHLRVCKADGSFCHFPVGRDTAMRWDFKISGDRWAFAIDVIDGSDNEIQGVCGVSTDKVTTIPSAPKPTTTTTTLTTTTRTASETPITTTTTKTSTKTSTTSTTKSTTKTSTKTSTTKTSTKTSTTPKATCTKNCN